MDKQLIERHYTRHGLVTDILAALPIVCLPVTIAFSILCSSEEMCPAEETRYATPFYPSRDLSISLSVLFNRDRCLERPMNRELNGL